MLDGFYLVSEPVLIQKNGICLVSKDSSFTVEISLSEEKINSKQFLQNYFSSNNAQGKIDPIQCGGLTGHSSIYRTKNEELFEAHFDLPDNDDEVYRLSILIITGHTPGIEAVMHHPQIERLLSEIKREEK